MISPFVIAKIGESHARALSRVAAASTRRAPQRIGLVHEVVEGDSALDAAIDGAVADVLAAGPTAARAAKAIVREVRGLGHGSSKWHTARVIARQRTSEEAQEGFRAFVEKRRPAWAPGARRGLTTPGDSTMRRSRHAMTDELSPSQAAARIGSDHAVGPALDRERAAARETRRGAMACRD